MNSRPCETRKQVSSAIKLAVKRRIGLALQSPDRAAREAEFALLHLHPGPMIPPGANRAVIRRQPTTLWKSKLRLHDFLRGTKRWEPLLRLGRVAKYQQIQYLTLPILHGPQDGQRRGLQFLGHRRHAVMVVQDQTAHETVAHRLLQLP